MIFYEITDSDHGKYKAISGSRGEEIYYMPCEMDNDKSTAILDEASTHLVFAYYQKIFFCYHSQYATFVPTSDKKQSCSTSTIPTDKIAIKDGKFCGYLHEETINNKTKIFFISSDGNSIDIINEIASSIDSYFEYSRGYQIFKVSGDIKYEEKILDNGARTVCRDSIEEVIVPNTTSEIIKLAFKDCSSIKSMTLPHSIGRIGEYAFSHCTSLESIHLPEKVAWTEEGAFYNCTALKRISYADGISVCLDGTAVKCISPSSKEFISQVWFAYIEKKAFYGCSSLELATFHRGAQFTGYDIFHNCPKLTIRAHDNSFANRYAKNHGIKFEEIE